MDKVNILTWNTKNQQSIVFYDLLKEMLDKFDIDILVLQENTDRTITRKLLKYEEISNIDTSARKWVRIFYNQNKTQIRYSDIQYELYNKLCFVNLEINGKYNFNLCGSHFYSKIPDEDEQENNNFNISQLIQGYEKSLKNKRTVLVGDFNYLAFDKGMNNPRMLNAVNSKAIIRQLQYRRSGRIDYPFFYNPMWNKLGDYDYINKTECIPGTFHLKNAAAGKFYWNLLDGVLLRDEMMDTIDIPSLQIISEFDNTKLVRNTISKGQSFIDEIYSDHLPVKFTLNLKNIK